MHGHHLKMGVGEDIYVKKQKKKKKNGLLLVPRVNYYPRHSGLIIWAYSLLVKFHFCFSGTETILPGFGAEVGRADL